MDQRGRYRMEDYQEYVCPRGIGGELHKPKTRGVIENRQPDRVSKSKGCKGKHAKGQVQGRGSMAVTKHTHQGDTQG